jgi:hypothetical protein
MKVKLGSNYRVQVSRMTPLLSASQVGPVGILSVSSRTCYAFCFLPTGSRCHVWRPRLSA